VSGWFSAKGVLIGIHVAKHCEFTPSPRVKGSVAVASVVTHQEGETADGVCGTRQDGREGV